jgi:hypothetical protein
MCAAAPPYFPTGTINESTSYIPIIACGSAHLL